MTRHEKLAKLESEAPHEIPLFLSCAKLLKKIDGISISGDQTTLLCIKEKLSFSPSTREGIELKTNILKQAKEKARQGMFGDGVF